MENKMYSSFFNRLVAFMLDIFILYVLGALVFILLLNSSNNENYIGNIILFITYILLVHGILMLLLNAYLVSKFGGTVGKLISGLNIENEDGSRLTVKQAIFREYIAKTVSFAFFGLGFFWIFKTQKKQAWHDMISSTVVVKKRNMIFGILSLILLLTLFIYLSIVAVTSASDLNKSFDGSVKNKVNYNSNPFNIY